MLHIPLGTLVGTALLVAAQTNSAAGQFLEQQSPDQWRTTKMIGLSVYGLNKEKIGVIGEILLDKNGNAEAAVIGVGGFLGIGTKDVAVPFKSLQWRMDRTSSASDERPSTTGSGGVSLPAQPPATPEQGYPHDAVLSMTQDQLKAAPEFKYSGSVSGSAQPSSKPARPE